MRALTHKHVLLIGDALAVAAFVVVGQYSHNVAGMSNAVLRAIGQIVAIVLPLIALAWLLGGYPVRRPDTWQEARCFLLRSALAVLYAVPVGLFVRAWMLGQPNVLLAFAAVALPFSALFVLGWRAVFAIVSVITSKR